jgi:putative membrane protein
MPINLMGRSVKDYLLLYVKGVSMGGADVIPGVSGGTVAFITGIYDELINSIKAIDWSVIKMLFQFRISEAWKTVNGNFLICILGGILTSLLSLSKLMTFLLNTYPIQVWSFFFGLILVSAPLIFRDIKQWKLGTIISGTAGVVAAYFITVISPTETPTNLPFIFFCGALAICAMILPGISGAFILLLIGKYEYMIAALINFDLEVIAVFASGCVLGLIGFSKILGWVLNHYRFPALAMLAGFMIGSLNKVWPWKEITKYRIDHLGNQVPAFDKSVSPDRFLEVTGTDPLVFQAILFSALGILLIVAIEKTASYLKTH